ncbi:MAG: DUF4280 domain-containing protein [Planctomycetes bacterium]|nr:DUF4280 domain-containing protein [Planctomycetota bacterium]
MGKLVVGGATLQCSMGLAPSTLIVPPDKTTDAGMMAAANVMDYKPTANIAPFGMCQSPSNPQVAAATVAAAGVPTPQPCIPMTVGPWTPGSSTFQVASQPALNDASTCTCNWGGSITITNPGQSSIDAP